MNWRIPCCLHEVDCVEAASLGHVCLAGRDDLVIGGAKAPPPIPVIVLINAEVHRHTSWVFDEMQTHLFSYRFDGKLWELEIKANNAEEAKALLSQLAFAKYDGTLVATIPASLGPVTRLAIWIRNSAAGLLHRFG